jgi:hypothetical protein
MPLESLAQLVIVTQLFCCNAILPVAGLLLGALGGVFTSGQFQGRSDGPPGDG